MKHYIFNMDEYGVSDTRFNANHSRGNWTTSGRGEWGDQWILTDSNGTSSAHGCAEQAATVEDLERTWFCTSHSYQATHIFFWKKNKE